MQFLITNDDGIDAPGIAAMVETMAQYADRRGWSDTKIWVVAPDRGRSECSHSVTTTRDLTINQVKPGWYAVDGTPVDCVRVAITCLCPEVDQVFSGINAGANVGLDLLVSGTFAAAREASLLGKPAMALSHYRRPDVPKSWGHVSGWLGGTLDRFFADQQELPTVWNVNLPALDPTTAQPPAMVECFVDNTRVPRTGHLDDANLEKLKLECSQRNEHGQPLVTPRSLANPEAIARLKSDFHGRPRQPGSDVDLCFAGNLTISRVCPELRMRPTHGSPLE